MRITRGTHRGINRTMDTALHSCGDLCRQTATQSNVCSLELPLRNAPRKSLPEEEGHRLDRHHWVHPHRGGEHTAISKKEPGNFPHLSVTVRCGVGGSGAHGAAARLVGGEERDVVHEAAGAPHRREVALKLRVGLRSILYRPVGRLRLGDRPEGGRGALVGADLKGAGGTLQAEGVDDAVLRRTVQRSGAEGRRGGERRGGDSG